MPRKYWERPNFSYHTAYNLFGIIAGTQTPLPQIEAYEHAVSMLGDNVNVSYVADTLAHPRLIYCRSAESLIVAFAGAQTGYMFQGLVAGYQQPADRINNSGVNPFGGAIAMAIGGVLIDQMAGIEHVLIGGYSYGCVVAWGLYNYLRRYRPGDDIRLKTFGSPKPGQQALYNQWQLNNQDQIIQYTNDNDPVPFVMPSLEQGPTIYRSVDTTSARNMNAYRHVLPFHQLTVNATPADDVPYPTRVNSNPEIAIASWMAGTEGWNTSGHHWTSYKQRLYLYSRAYPDVVSEGAPRLIEQLPTGPVADTLTAQYTPLAPPLFSRGDPPTPLPASILPPGTPRKRGDKYRVEWNGIPIATFTQGSKARRLKNTLKRLATSMRSAEEFEYESVDDALLYNRALEQNGQPTSIR